MHLTTATYQKFADLDQGQGACIYGDTCFGFYVDGTFVAYDLKENKRIGIFDLDQKESILPHCNMASFGKEYFNPQDLYPALYINAYNAPGLPKGTCYVHRMISNPDQTFSTKLLQTITVGFTDDPIWTNGPEDTRPYGNFCIDPENNILYVYTLLDTEQKTRFFKFHLPSIEEGDVVLTKDDILAFWDCDYFMHIQDNTCHHGKLYLCTGYGLENDRGYIRIVDPVQKEEIVRVDLNSLALPIEPEMIDFYHDELICGNQKIYRWNLT